MRAFALAVMLAGCAASATVQNDPPDVWRIHTEHLEGDRAAVQVCLDAGRSDCAELIQTNCRAGFSEEAQAPALDRQCDWRAIAAWEDEMDAALAVLRASLGGRDRDNLERSQHDWQRSMLSDVGLGMEMYEGGSLAGPVGARIRARATAERALYLREIQAMIE